MSINPLKIAKNIITLAQKIERGDNNILGPFDFADYDLGKCLFLLRAANHNTEFVTPYTPPEEAQIHAFALALGDDAPKLNDVYDASVNIVTPYLLHSSWERMSVNALTPISLDYQTFHEARRNMGLKAYSPELLQELNANHGKYRMIDQSYALIAIQDNIEHGKLLMAKLFSLGQAMVLNEKNEPIFNPEDEDDVQGLKLEFQLRSEADDAFEDVSHGIQALQIEHDQILEQSKLTIDQVKLFLNVMRADSIGHLKPN